ncbi:MAG: M28 family metallopeptidase [Clostridia bacterium]|nr:M28 family metallopeptidase [Clostridia bacterium]
MNTKDVKKIIKDTAYRRMCGKDSEKKAANYLLDYCKKLGVDAVIESFPTACGDVKSSKLIADGVEIPCEGYENCGSGKVTAPLLYMPNVDKYSLSQVKGKVVMIDSSYMDYFTYQDIEKAGAVGFITRNGDMNQPHHDIDVMVLHEGTCKNRKMLAANINIKDQFKMIKMGTKEVTIEVEQDEYMGTSQNVVASIPGLKDEWIVMSAHYDSRYLSLGSYDNMTGCVSLLYAMEKLSKGAPHNYGIKFVFCGGEELGELGSLAYVDKHKDELDKYMLNVNVDMIGTYLGKFHARVSAEEKLANYIEYTCAMKAWPIGVRVGAYSSDSTAFAGFGVPALSFARQAEDEAAPIHNRYDTPAVLSEKQILTDCDFICEFVREFADGAVCPIGRDIPEKVKKELDDHLNIKKLED